MIVWVDGIKCDWCLAGGRGCWLKRLHQNPSVSWPSHHSSTFLRLVLVYQVLSCLLHSYQKWWEDEIVEGWVIYISVWVGGQGMDIWKVFSFLLYICLLFSLSSVPFFKWLEHDSCFLSLFIFFVPGTHKGVTGV